MFSIFAFYLQKEECLDCSFLYSFICRCCCCSFFLSLSLTHSFTRVCPFGDERQAVKGTLFYIIHCAIIHCCSLLLFFVFFFDVFISLHDHAISQNLPLFLCNFFRDCLKYSYISIRDSVQYLNCQ